LEKLGSYRDVDEVQSQRSSQKVPTESRSDDQRYGQHERCEKVEESFVDFLEDEEFGAEFPPSEFPGSEDVSVQQVSTRVCETCFGSSYAML
jgi:hypothetical protein